ncbi:IspD/TarI family cytidylyltransferase [Clostridium sp. HMP27]|uniref:IspD/TarI family cytidylyltransferase n=1 Tax=Clostridium sp. HMP27 TaxID=1487921 RepID=UPI00052BCDA7|nr:IspD/TarI family cytidylyltransferase [Clostridium sp. HMP27]KGK86062.1 2-C-methyl-D-erythritol 4-phosphate cytidylyltransferase [Clostridium sp. HMP27]
MNIAIILAGGIGSRMGIKDMPKQFIDVYGKPILVHTLESFDSNMNIDSICIVTLKDYIEEVNILLRKFEINKVKWVIEGGSNRQESTLKGLQAIEKDCKEDDIIVIHDSVRPLISQRIIDDNIKSAKEFGAVDTVIHTSDTIIRSIDNQSIDSVPIRKELFLGQTPQSFKFSIIKEAHECAIKNKIEDATDDCQLVLKMNKKIQLVLGEKLNFKITSFDDLAMLKALIKIGNV